MNMVTLIVLESGLIQAGKGVIENAMREGRETYFRTVKEEMRKRV